MHKEHSQPNLALRVSLFGVGVKRRVEIDEIDAGIGEFFRIPQPAKVIAEVELAVIGMAWRLGKVS
jgi:hypothetical protein